MVSSVMAASSMLVSAGGFETEQLAHQGALSVAVLGSRTRTPCSCTAYMRRGMYPASRIRSSVTTYVRGPRGTPSRLSGYMQRGMYYINREA